jgi:two-component system chemotaxis sensor kinase CheA
MSNNEILREFLLETHENLSLLDSDLVKLESHPEEKATLAQVFRTLHSVKGTAGFMGLVKLQAVAHSAESLLGRLRQGEIRFNPPIATALLRVVDAIREILANIESSGGEGSGDYTALAAEVDRLRESGEQRAKSREQEELLAPREPVSSEQTLALPPVAPVPPLPLPGEPSAVDGMTSASDVQPALPAAGDPRPASVSDAAIRVDVGLLDKLMTLVGELVLARNQILQQCELREDGFWNVVQRLNVLTTELQASVMKTRMQPIGNVLGKFPRIVRDLSLACSKKVRFEMEGQDTELDKTLIEAIRDPLTHIIRNSVDHGIEPPHVRTARGKPEEGRLRVVAFHEGGKVIIEITDDGVGIDVARVRDKALAAKLVSPEIAARMSPQELQRLIFLPGFSTAERVTQFSGRGVGMDVVRTNIEKIGGTVDLESTPGEGTTIRTKIPLTLAIIPALIVATGGERFAIPQVSLLELVRLEPEQARQGIERLHGVPVYRLRGALLPLVFLDEQLELSTTRGEQDDLNIVVLQADDRPFGLVVDAIRDTEEIVVKPLQQELKGISVFAGATIMGDGRVALVLDVVGLAQRANVISALADRGLADEQSPARPDSAESQSLLIFEPTDGGQMAIPLSLVSRLEEFPRSRLEKLGSRQVVQYREEILPLIDVSQELSALSGRNVPHEPQPADDDESIPVVVYTENGDRVGLIVRKILDVVNEPITARSRAHRPGTLFTSVVQERVTEIVDVVALVREVTRDIAQNVN